MKFSFNFFGTQEIRKFSYKPRFYDQEKEERRRKFGDHSASAQKKAYVPGSHVKGALRDGNYARTKDASESHKLLGMVTMVLLFLVIYLIYKYFPLLLQAMGV